MLFSLGVVDGKLLTNYAHIFFISSQGCRIELLLRLVAFPKTASLREGCKNEEMRPWKANMVYVMIWQKMWWLVEIYEMRICCFLQSNILRVVDAMSLEMNKLTWALLMTQLSGKSFSMTATATAGQLAF
ncbi:hypothetical protein BRADI_1g44605v3 [Brachypodium distachyon]|uniref:Uncharacterized protein n=1 Tax=Brachypodium distachyon TaxID=15368 RepID=A0A2K2DPD0_BRADI|nr:hypothetical protein BRADI_1g44605v3 [Brachypodium distachyon]